LSGWSLINLNCKTNLIFPVPIHQIDVNGFEEIENELIDYCYAMKRQNPIGVSISNLGGWQSPSFDVDNKDDLIQYFLINCLSKFSVIKRQTKMYIRAWININQKENYNAQHCHPTSHLSGVLWLKTPKNCGNLLFVNPLSFQAFKEIESYTDEFRFKNNYDHNYCYNAIKGRMIIFPSHLQHSVEPNESYEDRISVSFNIKLEE